MIEAAFAVTLLVAINALFVAGEFAAVGARRTRIAELARGGHPGAAAIAPVLEDGDRLDDLVAACQVGITASSLVLGAYGQAAIARPIVAPWLAGQGWLGSLGAFSAAVTIVLLSLTTLQVVLGELVPKAIALRYPESMLLSLQNPLRLSMRLLSPLTTLFNGSAGLLLRLVGTPEAPRHARLHSPQEIEFLATEASDAGDLNDFERVMLHNAFDLTELVARQVMVPRNRLELANLDASVEEQLRRVVATSGSRLAVYRDSPDQVVGSVHLVDLLRAFIRGGPEAGADDIVRPAPLVPETLPLPELWLELLHRSEPMAVVLDEYGGTAGIVTQEDLLEEIMGEVRDEFDTRPEAFVAHSDGSTLVRGDVLVEDVNDALEAALPTDRADTIGGLVVDELGRIPSPGDTVTIGALVLRVYAVRGRSVARVSVTHTNAEGPS